MAIHSISNLDTGVSGVATYDESTTGQPVDSFLRAANMATTNTLTAALLSGTALTFVGSTPLPNRATRALALSIATALRAGGTSLGAFIRTTVGAYTGAIANGLCWKQQQLYRPACFVVSPLTTPNGRGAIRLTISPGDDPFNTGSGLTRAEFAYLATTSGTQLTDVTGTTKWYGTSYNFPVGFNGNAQSGNGGKSWFIILQEHGPDVLSASPTWAIYAGTPTPGSTTPILFLATNGGDVTTAHVTRTYFSDPTGAFTSIGGPDAIQPGQWVRLIVEVNYAIDNTGYYKVYRINEANNQPVLVASVTGVQTIQYNTTYPNPGPHYLKQGCYRGPVSSTQTDTFDFGDLVYGSSLADTATLLTT